jgi:hypothetical protein
VPFYAISNGQSLPVAPESSPFFSHSSALISGGSSWAGGAEALSFGGGLRFTGSFQSPLRRINSLIFEQTNREMYAAVWADWCHLQLNRGAISNSFGRGVDQSRVQRYNCAYEPRIGRSRPGSD